MSEGFNDRTEKVWLACCGRKSRRVTGRTWFEARAKAAVLLHADVPALEVLPWPHGSRARLRSLRAELRRRHGEAS